jgi:ABC-type multidrug transport system fused ATPase/permease subunit
MTIWDKFKMSKSLSGLTSLGKFLKYKQIRVRPIHWLAPLSLYGLAAFFDVISIVGLIPITKGIISGNFAFTRQFPLFDKLFRGTPGNVIPNTTIFIILIAVVFFSSVVRSTLQYLAALIISFQVRKFSNIMRQVIFNRYLSFGKMFFDKSNSGYLQTVLLNFPTMVTNELRTIELLMDSIFRLVVYLLIMFIISWRLALLVTLLFPVLNLLLRIIIKKIDKSSKSYALSFAKLSGYASNILTCIPLVKLYSQEKIENSKFAKLSTDIEKIAFSVDKKQKLILPIQEIVFLTAILILVSFAAFIIVKERAGEIATFLVFFFILRRAATSFGHFYSMQASLAIISGPIAALMEMLGDNGKYFIPQGDKEFKGLENAIEIRHLYFSYVPGVEVLNNVSFTINKGSKVAIVGPTGSGKTTLANLLLRFYDCNPESIFIDGVDIRSFTSQSLGKHMSLVSQDPLLFNDTLRNNITYGLNRDVSEDELVMVVKKARLYDYVVNLPEKMETFIGDKGVRLSGGEKQRLSIARAIIKNAEILFLDEATSSLDSHTERLVQEAIDEAVKERTTIVIAHRFSTIKNADGILVIENGKLIEYGPLDELLSKKGKLFEYWQQQKFY